MTDFDSNREWANKISEILEHSTKESLLDYLEKLEIKWKIPDNFTDIFSNTLQNFSIRNINSIDMAIIEIEYNKIVWEVTGVHARFVRLFTLDDTLKERWEKLFENIYYCERFVRTGFILNKMKMDKYTNSLNEDNCGLFRFMPINYDKNTPYQNLLLYISNKLGTDKREYARYGTNLYIKVLTKEGFSTHAWENYKSIKEFIYEACKMQFNFDQWKNSTAGGGCNITNAEKYFMEYKGPELIELEKDRYLFAFKNGNYITKYNIGTELCPKYTDIYIPYGNSHPYINSQSVACKYFDINFNNFDEIPRKSWFSIMKKCPNFKKILDYQEFPEEVQMWLCIFMGRNGYNIGDMDTWQAVMYLLGQANSGKSTILTKILSKWYDEEDVGIISNNIDTKFGIKPHAKRFMVLAPEIKDNFKMEQTDWQMVVEGGRNTYSEKYKNDETITWKSHMSMGGNQLPRYKNNSESVSRRTVVWNFWKKVFETDTELDKKLLDEIPYIMKMCISGYIWAVETYGKKGIWNVLPKYFHENKEEMEQTTNSLQNFLSSGKVTLDKEVYIPEKMFKQAFNDHCRENNLPKEQFTSDYYSGIFTNNGIKIKKRTRKLYPINSDQYIHGTYFVGIDVINDAQQTFFDVNI